MCIRHELLILYQLQEEIDYYRTIGKREESSDIAEYHFTTTLSPSVEGQL